MNNAMVLLPSRSPILPLPAAPFSKATLLAECFKLRELMAYDPQDGFYFWPQDTGLLIPEHADKCGICTNGARLIAGKFGGYVAGYPIGPGDPQTLVGAVAGGHDFAVVGNFIVVWWGWEYEQSLESPVLLRAEGVALGKYKL